MKKTISILMIVLLLAVALVAIVACNPENPEDPANPDTPAISYEVTAAEWDDAFNLANDENFTICCSYEIAEDGNSYAYEGYISSDGKSMQTTHYLYNVDPDDSNNRNIENAEIFIITKDFNGECWACESTELTVEGWIWDNGDFVCYGDDDSYYYEMMNEAWTYEFEGIFEQFTFNPTTKLYEAQNVCNLEDVKVQFEDGKWTSVTIITDGVTMKWTATYGTADTIVFPTKYTINDIDEWNKAISLQNATNFTAVCSFVAPSDMDFADSGEYILAFDGTTYNYQNKYYLDGETVLDSSILLTKKGDTYLSYTEGTIEEITKEFYDEVYTEFPPISMSYNNADLFTYNPVSKMYELNSDVDLGGVSNFKVSFENGRVVKIEFSIDGDPWTCVFTYGTADTIVFPDNN